MVTALTAGLRASTRAIAASSSSSGFTSRRATSAASPSPSCRSYSANPPINHRGGPRHGPPHPRTLGRAPAEPWRASGLTQDVSSVLLYRGHSTVESARARMGWHLPFDRTERCLTRGQCALARRDFATAEALLREALAQDPQYSHIQMYLAHALAEQERRAEAEAALERAMALAPDNFVFPLHLGIIRLDADDAAGAREALPRAARLASDNALVAGYLDLVAWETSGRRDTLAAVGRRARDLPESFRARLLLRLAATTLAARGPKAALALLEPPPERPFEIPLPASLRRRRRRRRLARARRLADAGRFEEAADTLAVQPDVLDEPGARELLARARRRAVEAATAALERAEPRERRALLLRRYEYEKIGRAH